MNKAKSYSISKKLVYEAYLRVKANKGAPGVDDVTIEEFERNLKDNLYKIWNRMSSGSYFPPAVKAVEIAKTSGKTRVLGIPTVGDRIAQMVVKMQLEAIVEPKFHEDSYGYRPNKSAHQALEKARARCWKFAWVVDIDIQGFFDNIDHELMMKAVRHHTDEKWVLLYIERWLKAPLQTATGQESRSKGTPQGGVISPLLANLLMHHAFDKWINKHYPEVLFERYADDIIIHCHSPDKAMQVLESVRKRLKDCKLELHPEKTKVVYCKTSNRKLKYRHVCFDFLGYCFRPRKAMNYKGEIFTSFFPAISKQAKKHIWLEIRKWRIWRRSDKSIGELANMYNAKIRGWINYYGKYGRNQLRETLYEIDKDLIQWARRKYKRLKRSLLKAVQLVEGIAKREPTLFEHWKQAVSNQ